MSKPAPSKQDDSNVIEKEPEVKKQSQTLTKPKTKTPPMWNVRLHNDNVTPHRCVVEILYVVFGLDQNTSVRGMQMAERNGSAVIATYPKPMAEEKVEQAIQMSREMSADEGGQGFPHPFELSITCNEQNDDGQET